MEKYEITDKKPGPFFWAFAILLIGFLAGTYFLLFHVMP
jgi:hypothetical protein